MKNFMIGMHRKYDFQKFNRDYHKDFYGIEICLFEKGDIVSLVEQSEKNNFKYGIHFPLRRGNDHIRDACFLSLNDSERLQSFKRIEDELRYIKSYNLSPEYILFHFPKPAIIDRNFDLARWRFSYRSEYVYEDEYPIELFRKYSKELFKWLSRKSIEYKFIPVLELDALNKYILNDDYIDMLLKKYTSIKICLDIGRIHIQNVINHNFDVNNLIKRFGKYTFLVHLWNAKPGDMKYYHYPPLKKLKKEDGFADIQEYLGLIKNENDDFKILFEHRSEVVSYDELQECYDYVENIMKDTTI